MWARYKEVIFLVVLSVIFFFGYLFLYINPFLLGPGTGAEPTHLVLNQPDESANYLFIRQLALQDKFGYNEPLSVVALNQVHPRSTTVVGNKLVPISFPGFIVLVAFFSKILLMFLGPGWFNLVAVSFTPLIAVLTPLFFYGFLRRIFAKPVAALSAMGLFVLPAWHYYASRPFQHNVLFVCFVVLVFYCFSVFWERRDQKNKIGLAFAIGLFFGLAVYVRPSETAWLTGLFIVLMVVTRKAWHLREYLALGSAVAVAVIIFLATQTAFYGQPFGSGYVRPTPTGEAGLVSAGPQGIPMVQAIFLPFGFHPRVMWFNFLGYFVKLSGLWTLLAFVGFFTWLITSIRRPNLEFGIWNLEFKQRLYFVLFGLVALYLLAFYGSWLFFDNLVNQFSIGSSHARYFLPIYVFALPLVAWFFVWLWRRGWILKIAAVTLAITLLVFSSLAVFTPLEGLAKIKNTLTDYRDWQNRIYELTPANAVILTRYADKYVFPGRKVITGWQEPEQIQALGALVKANHPVYLYDLKLPVETEKSLNDLLKPVGAKLGPKIAGWADLELRQIIKY
jgi:hypothetical protein